MKLLHLDSSILGANSVSRVLSAAAVERMRSEVPGLAVVSRDLSVDAVPHLSGAYLAAQTAGSDHGPELAADLALGSEILEEFLAADIVVIGVAMYNLSIPSQLKAWIDRIMVAGRTFRYTEHGAEGLVGDKRVVLCIARGGVYGPGQPAAPFEHAERYLQAIFNFIGVRPEAVVAEGIAMGPDQREAAIEGALGAILRLAA